jgi:hypothetical protein
MRIISQLAIERAAQAWCAPETEHKVMDQTLCMQFAKILDTELWTPKLGCATTKQLLDELAARVNLDYKTVGEIPATLGEHA